MRCATPTAGGLKRSAVLLGTLLIAACATEPPLAATETEAALCDAWRAALPSRSREDTAITQYEIDQLYDAFEAVCGPLPAWVTGG